MASTNKLVPIKLPQRRLRNGSPAIKLKLGLGRYHYCPVSTDEKLARRNAKLKEKDLAKGLFTEKEVTKIQSKQVLNHSLDQDITEIDAAVNEYVEAKESEPELTARYVEDEKFLIRGCMRYFKDHPELKTGQFSQIRSKHIWDFRDHLLKEVKKETRTTVSASNKLNGVKRFFKFLRKRGVIHMDPCLEVDPIKFNSQKTARKVSLPFDVVSKINEVEYEHLYKFPLKEFVNFLILTGARTGEALHAEADDFDLDQGIWRISNKPGCPTKFGLGWKPKNGTERIVPLTCEAIVLLRPLIEEARQKKIVGYVKDRKEPVRAQFIFSLIDRKLSTRRKDAKRGAPDVLVWRRTDSIKKSWKNLFIKAGICVPDMDKEGKLLVMYRRHDARRSWNEQAEKLGLSLKERSAILGHDPRVNKSNYNGESFIDLESVSSRLRHLKVVGS